MIKFECRDLEFDCNYVAMAETSEEVVDLVMAHAVKAHGDLLEKMTPEQFDDIGFKIEGIIQKNDNQAV